MESISGCQAGTNGPICHIRHIWELAENKMGKKQIGEKGYWMESEEVWESVWHG